MKKSKNAAQQPEFVYIRVRRAVVLPIQTAAINLPLTNLPSTASGHMYLIEGTLEDIRRYAGATIDWVIKIAQLICDPLCEGRLYTHTTGTPPHWYDLDRTTDWRQVVPGDSLRSGIYEFEPVSPIVLSKISQRTMHSSTSHGSASSSSTFRKHISDRDGNQCMVTSVPNGLIASHLIPKRIGTDGTYNIVTRFSGGQAAIGIHRYDPRVGILLSSPLDGHLDNYKLGFWHITVSHCLQVQYFVIVNDVT